MENILLYLENHYITFIVLTVLMLFALAGYFAKKKADADKPYKLADENAKAEQELEELAQKVNKGASLQDFMSHTATLDTSVAQAAPQPVPALEAAPVAPEAPAPAAPVSDQIMAQQAVPQAPVQPTQNGVENL